MDDGWYPSQSALNFLKSNNISTTSFIIEDAMNENPGFWKAYAQIGNLEDHTVSHPDLETISYAQDLYQIEGQRNAIQALIGITPYMLRPPYGDTDAQVVEAAQQSGMKYVVMWSAELEYNSEGVYTSNPPLETWNGGPLASGEIILVHWDPNVTVALESLYQTIRRDGLTVGNLAQYLPR
jgi:peptidoglycan/xylan/chitin deacetylase (PgdA/CDA1 family)